MNEYEDDESQEVADARESIGLAESVLLKLAVRAVEHVEENDVAAVTVEEELDGKGFVWDLQAVYAIRRHTVHVIAHARPPANGPMAVPPQTFARILGNQEAGFGADVPVEWVRMAAAEQERRSNTVVGVAAHDAKPGEPLAVRTQGDVES